MFKFKFKVQMEKFKTMFYHYPIFPHYYNTIDQCHKMSSLLEKPTFLNKSCQIPPRPGRAYS